MGWRSRLFSPRHRGLSAFRETDLFFSSQPALGLTAAKMAEVAGRLAPRRLSLLNNFVSAGRNKWAGGYLDDRCAGMNGVHRVIV